MAKDDKDFGSVLNALKSRYPGKIYTAGEYTMPWSIKRLSTGVLDLDIALQGGLPAGGLSFFVGKQGVGKNWLANQVIREHQQQYGKDTNVAIVSTEMVYDKDFAVSCGVKVAFSDEEIQKKSERLEEMTGSGLTLEEVDALKEQIGEFITIPPCTAEESFDIALDLIASRQFDIVVIDSFGSLLTEHDEEQSMSDSPRVGGAALLNTRFARRLNKALAPNKNGDPNLTTVIGINQVRDNTDRANKYSPKTIEAGGWALKHARWVTVQLSPIGKIKEGKNILGKTVRWEITKQKAGGHEGAHGSYDFLYSRCGINRAAHSVSVAGDYGVVQRSGAWYSYEGERIGQGVKKAAEHVEDCGLLEEIELKTLQKVGIQGNY